jgi:hypothetical protein
MFRFAEQLPGMTDCAGGLRISCAMLPARRPRAAFELLRLPLADGIFEETR